jgi:hypothetical protein
LSVTLFSHNFTSEAYAPLAIAWAAVGEVSKINTAQIIAFAAVAPEPPAIATPISNSIVPKVTHLVEACKRL